ncbi:MAG TPA: hypothetical protein VKN63_11835 [Afifellaceae bacterium]|nr:hypothetical protein [Afifellaceae bacterium]
MTSGRVNDGRLQAGEANLGYNRAGSSAGFARYQSSNGASPNNRILLFSISKNMESIEFCIPLRQCSNESVSRNIAVRLQSVSNLREEAGPMNLARPINLIVFCAAFLFVGAIVVGAF